MNLIITTGEFLGIPVYEIIGELLDRKNCGIVVTIWLLLLPLFYREPYTPLVLSSDRCVPALK